MAFLGKVGTILRQTASKQLSSDISASRPSIYQAIRCMSSSKLFVGGASSSSPSSFVFKLSLTLYLKVGVRLNKFDIAGISYQTDDTSLREAFGKYGEVIEGM